MQFNSTKAGLHVHVHVIMYMYLNNLNLIQGIHQSPPPFPAGTKFCIINVHAFIYTCAVHYCYMYIHVHDYIDVILFLLSPNTYFWGFDIRKHLTLISVLFNFILSDGI